MSYDPTIGRFMAEDPIAFESGDVNIFRYVKNSPTNSIDPSGLLTEGQKKLLRDRLGTDAQKVVAIIINGPAKS